MDEMITAADDEFAVEVPLEVPPTASSATNPLLLHDDHRTILVYQTLLNEDAGEAHETTSVTSGPGSPYTAITPDSPEAFGILRFSHCRDVWFGGPNDEGLVRHRLYGRGLNFYGFHIVQNSRWAAVSYGKDDPRGTQLPLHARLNHYILAFHESTFECLAKSFDVQRRYGRPSEVLLALLEGQI